MSVCVCVALKNTRVADGSFFHEGKIKSLKKRGNRTESSTPYISVVIEDEAIFLASAKVNMRFFFRFAKLCCVFFVSGKL